MKRPPYSNMVAIYEAADSTPRTCRELSEAAGLNMATAKVAIAWMRNAGNLVGHKRPGVERCYAYSQGTPPCEKVKSVVVADERGGLWDFGPLMEVWQ